MIIRDSLGYNKFHANYSKMVFATRRSLKQFCTVYARSCWTSHTPLTLLHRGCIYHVYACFPFDAVSSSDWLIVEDGQSVFLRPSLDPSWIMATDDCFAEKVAPLSFHNDRLVSNTIGRLISRFLPYWKSTPQDDFPCCLLGNGWFCVARKRGGMFQS